MKKEAARQSQVVVSSPLFLSDLNQSVFGLTDFVNHEQTTAEGRKRTLQITRVHCGETSRHIVGKRFCVCNFSFVLFVCFWCVCVCVCVRE